MTTPETAVSEKPIQFSGPMVRAIMAGNKTQTRRAFNDYRIRFFRAAAKAGEISDFLDTGVLEPNDPSYIIDHCPYGNAGDRLWVKETFAGFGSEKQPQSGDAIIYRASEQCDHAYGWRPSIFMPRWASRITLEITGLRVERLNDISEADAKAEGVDWAAAGYNAVYEEPRAAYKTLWESINGAGSWAKNPWCWALSFKRVNP